MGDLEGESQVYECWVDLLEWALHSLAFKSTSFHSIVVNGGRSVSSNGIIGRRCVHQAQFLLNCKQDLGCNEEVEMKLYMDSTSAQAFFQRLGPGKAKHLSTRILWGQSAMRKQWFKVARISTQNNPADLNTKSLSRERRESLEQLIGLHSNTFKEQTMPSARRVIHLLAAAGFLKRMWRRCRQLHERKRIR